MTLATSLSKVRKAVSFSLLALLTVVVIFSAWPVRDHELVVRIAEVGSSEPIELYNERIFCTSLPECFRVANKVVLAGSRVVTNGIVEGFHLLPGSSVTEVPVWAPQYTRNLAPYLMLRVLVLVGMAYTLRIYVKRWWVVAVLANVLLFWSTGVPIRTVTSLYLWLLDLIGRTDFYPNLLDWHISRNSTIFLLEYDYIALLAVLVFPVLLAKQFLQEHLLLSALFGAAMAFTFENLAAVYIIALLYSTWRLTKRITFKQPFFIAAGWSIPIISLIVYAKLSNPNAGTPLVAITKLGYSINSGYRPLIFRLLIGFLVLPYLLGILTEAILSRGGVNIVWNHQLRVYINGVVLGLCFSFFVGYFHSALATEFGRQSIGAQVLLFLSGFLARQARHERKARAQSADSAATAGDVVR